ncbi:MAG: HAMP domain-containing histidine kinase [Deltaproteobacteria bacterium]|nr:HAMP domain-containing histidine kinase [Deltaproteobacteria bacterium]
MKIRFSILGKVAAWLVGNVVLVALVALVLFSTSIGGGIGKTVQRQADDRLRSLSRVLGSELASAETSEWSALLVRYSENYGVDFALCGSDGLVIAGTPTALPESVRVGVVDLMERESKRRERAGIGRGRPDGFGPPADRPPREGTERDERGGFPGGPPPAPPPIAGPDLRFSEASGVPRSYWTAHEIAVVTRRFAPPEHFAMVIRSDSRTANGLLFDPRPWIALGTILGLVTLLWWIPAVWHITRPLRRMTEATGRIAAGDFDTRVDETRGDEIGRLGAAINHMARQLDGYVRGQKRFLGDIAHELGSPIARVQMSLGILESRVAEPDRVRVEDTIEEVRQLSDLVGELLSFTRAQTAPQTIRREIVNLRATVDRALEREAQGRAIRVTLDREVRVLGSEVLIVRAVANVVRNAVKYAGDTPIEIDGHGESGTVRLRIRDHGPGVPEEDLPHLFEPFYRPDASRTRDTGGTGLGLAIVQTCVKACGGVARARNVAGGGFEVELEFDGASSAA